MDLVRAARKELITKPSVTSLLGSNTTFSDGWIFQWRPYVNIEGTGEALIVLSTRGGWTAPNKHNTAGFPRLQVEIFQDHTRDTNLNPDAGSPPTTEEKAEIIYKAVDSYLHIPASRPTVWGGVGGLRIVSSIRHSEPEIVEVPGGDGVVRCLASYEITV